ncbi:DUF1648 domain-containing protein [Vaginella massiliensis]|uniref:DUF1648 domain-containing protein n=1 Tax=Vaginella massiliensis TaxID=1816680 RepID=UPI000837F552|nr:DUF1648 domain-containing protein [Vaginella massiliensis]
MSKRPKIKIELTTTDKLLEALGWIAVLGIWVLTATNYTNLPEIIPTHYNAAGQADGFGDKANILSLPIVATVLFVGMTILNKFPHVFNYLTEITIDNARQQYTYATRMMRYLKLILVVVFGLIALQTIRQADGQEKELGAWFLPLFLGLVFLPIFNYLIKSSKAEK